MLQLYLQSTRRSILIRLYNLITTTRSSHSQQLLKRRILFIILNSRIQIIPLGSQFNEIFPFTSLHRLSYPSPTVTLHFLERSTKDKVAGLVRKIKRILGAMAKKTTVETKNGKTGAIAEKMIETSDGEIEATIAEGAEQILEQEEYMDVLLEVYMERILLEAYMGLTLQEVFMELILLEAFMELILLEVFMELILLEVFMELILLEAFMELILLEVFMVLILLEVYMELILLVVFMEIILLEVYMELILQ
eukprot:TRINITY_DN262_c0_g1_i8.p2 TRINITY_DN262_c0_g1~~TRINITY_DN262_c0_g1_i8.p2  ORF type:complete len:251 (-),score=19.08 TRINITY_DN262_c0_g1_i8:651-1403(-)